MNPAKPPAPPGPTTGPRKLALLAALFTLLMLAVAFGLWFVIARQQPSARSRPPDLLIQSPSVRTAAGMPATLRARVVEDRGRPVEGFVLEFWLDRELVGRVATGSDGWADVPATFARTGRFQVDVRPAATEKRDFRVIGRAVLTVTVE